MQKEEGREGVRIYILGTKKKLAEIFFKIIEGAETRTHDLPQAAPNFSKSITKQAKFTSAPFAHQILHNLFFSLDRNFHTIFFPQKVGVSIDTPCTHVAPPLILSTQT